MKTKLYLVATRSKHGDHQVIYISTSGYANSNDAVVLDEFDFENEVKQSEDEIDIMLDALKGDKIAELREELAKLESL